MRVLAPFDSVADDATLTTLLATTGTALALLAVFMTSRKNAPKSDDKTRHVHTLPRRQVLLGDSKEMGENAERLHEWMYETSLRFNGEPWRFHLPGVVETTVLTTPELVKEVLGTQADNFIRGEVTNESLEDMMGRSLISSDGPKWYHQRKAVIKFFSGRALRTCMQVHMRKSVEQLSGVLDRSIKDGTSVDMLPLFQEFAMQTFAELALGIELNVIGAKDAHVLESAIREGGPVILRRSSVPVFWWKLERWLNIEPERTMQKTMQAARTWLNKVVPESLAAVAAQQQARADAGTTGDEVKSLVELFLDQIDEDTDGLRAQDLPEMILSLVIGARGTSATSLAWFFLLMAKHPEVEQRIRDEMEALLPNVHDDSFVISDQLSKLVYFEAVLKETLRLYPSIPTNQRVANADTVIGGSIQVKKGDNFFIPTYALARLPTIWGPDAAEFKPERWINAETGELIIYSTNKFLTFSTGARQCVGMRLAMLELRVAIVNMMKRYRFSLAQPNDMKHIMSTELIPAQPLIMNWTRKPLTQTA